MIEYDETKKANRNIKCNDEIIAKLSNNLIIYFEYGNCF